MIVVADTSPLNYLIRIECVSLLKQLYGRVLVPETVMSELRDPRAPSAVVSWATQPLEVIEVCAPSAPVDETITGLGIGERDAIQLAQERNADMILIDELRGRTEARRRGFETTGTLGILMTAGQRGLVDAERMLRRLTIETNFRVGSALLEDLIRRARNYRDR